MEKLGMQILTQNEQELLGSPQGKDRNEAAAFSVDDVMDCVAETSLPFLPLLMNVCAICGFLMQITTKHYCSAFLCEDFICV